MEGISLANLVIFAFCGVQVPTTRSSGRSSGSLTKAENNVQYGVLSSVILDGPLYHHVLVLNTVILSLSAARSHVPANGAWPACTERSSSSSGAEHIEPSSYEVHPAQQTPVHAILPQVQRRDEVSYPGYLLLSVKYASRTETKPNPPTAPTTRIYG